MLYQDTEAFKAFLPLLQAMKIFGVYHTKHQDAIQDCETKRKTFWPKLTISHVYCIFVFLLFGSLTCINIALYKAPSTFGVQLFSKISALIIYFQIIFNMYTFYVASGVLPKFFVDFNVFYQRFRPREGLCPKLKFKVKATMCFFLFCALVNFSVVLYRLLKGYWLQTEASYVTKSAALNIILKLWTAINSMHKAALFLSPLLFMVLMCKLFACFNILLVEANS